MITGIGLDIVEIGRIRKLVESQPRFPHRVLTEAELAVFNGHKLERGIEFLAGRFAAKEAFSKARGTGIGRELSFQDIEILADRKGRPMVVKPVGDHVHLSISHSEQYAVAQAIIEKK